jgi:hypothetical protein
VTQNGQLVQECPGSACIGNRALLPVIPKDLNEIPIINFWMFGSEPSETGLSVARHKS